MANLRRSLPATLGAARYPDAEAASSAILAQDGTATDLSDERRLALIATDPLAIQDLVLTSRRFKSRWGASDRLRAWDEGVSSGASWGSQVRGTTLYAGGGQAVVLLPADDAEGVRDALVRGFRNRLHGELGTALLPVSPRELRDGPQPVSMDAAFARRHGLGTAPRGFGGLLAVLNALLRTDKDRPRSAEATKPARRCDECGLRDGTESYRYKEREARVCGVCLDFARHASDAASADAKRAFESFDELTEGALAFLAVDGTEVGATLMRRTGLGTYAELSQALDHAFRRDSVEGVLRGHGIGGLPVLAGGDDLLFVFAADRAPGPLRVAIQVLEAIQARLKERGVEDVGAGAGLVVSGTLGAREAFDLARHLVKSAKRRARQVKDARFALDFERVGAGAVLSNALEEVRKDRVVALEGVGSVRMCQRPLTLEEAGRIDEIAEWAGGEPGASGALYRIRDRLLEDGLSALLEADHLLRRHQRDLRARLHPDPAEPKAGSVAGLPWKVAGDQGLYFRRSPDAGPHAPQWDTAVPDVIDAIALRENARR